MLLDPPGWSDWPQSLPHWPYVQAVDAALTGQGIPPGIVRVNCTAPRYGRTMYMILVWDVSRTGGRGGVRLNWEEETGWAYGLLDLTWREPLWAPNKLGLHSDDAIAGGSVTALHRTFADPHEVAAAAGHLVHHWRPPGGAYDTPWHQEEEVRAAITAFRQHTTG
ncbi:hypothetical protein GCM10010129_70720 [Streptomyces fumigatiscleroticus]|nr:hypothetical protein GCM10010129_70720 [Streptomyces fumigatiscleroticus]